MPSSGQKGLRKLVSGTSRPPTFTRTLSTPSGQSDGAVALAFAGGLAFALAFGFARELALAGGPALGPGRAGLMRSRLLGGGGHSVGRLLLGRPGAQQRLLQPTPLLLGLLHRAPSL